MTSSNRERLKSRRAIVAGALAVAGVVVGVAVALTRASPDTPIASDASRISAASAPVLAPAPNAWSTLTPVEQQALKPLQDRWAVLDARAKAHWIQVADHLQGKPSRAIARAAQHMEAWQALTKAERAQARRHYVMALQLSRAERRQRWETYQASLHRSPTLGSSTPAAATVLQTAASASEGAPPLMPQLHPDSLPGLKVRAIQSASHASSVPAPTHDAS